MKRVKTLFPDKSHIHFRTKCVIVTLGATTNEILEFRKIIEFQSWTFIEISKNSWTVNELRTCLIINEKRSSDIYKIIKKSRNWSAIKVLGSYTRSAQFVSG